MLQLFKNDIVLFSIVEFFRFRLIRSVRVDFQFWPRIISSQHFQWALNAKRKREKTKNQKRYSYEMRPVRCLSLCLSHSNLSKTQLQWPDWIKMIYELIELTIFDKFINIFELIIFIQSVQWVFSSQLSFSNDVFPEISVICRLRDVICRHE